MSRLTFPLIAFAATAFTAGCAPQRLVVPEPLPRVQKQEGDSTLSMPQVGQASARSELQRSATPGIPGSGNNTLVAGNTGGEALPPLKGGAVNVNIEGMPVPAFINEFFGTILGVGFQMDPQVSRMQDLVTLRTPGPQSPQNFYRLAVQVLRTYGVATEYSSGLVFFNRARDNTGGLTPLIVSGRTLPEVPITHRPVFQLVEMQAVRANDVANLLNIAFKDSGLTIQQESGRNAVMLMGKPDLVRQAVEAIRVLDRPYMRGRVSARLEPAFVTASDLSKRLVEVLGAEGYGAAIYSSGGTAGTAVLVLPLEAANAVLVFAADRNVLDHAVEWARSIDKPNPTAGSDGLFYYMVKNTRAGEIVKTITGVRGGSRNTSEASRDAIDGSQVGMAPPPAAAPGATATAPGGSGDLSKGQLSLDEPRNAIIYQGSATDWGRLLPLIQQMDRAPRQVMIEVTVAEVTLTNDQEFGVAWLARNSDLGKYNGNISSGALMTGTPGGAGLNYILDIGGQARASLKALASQDRISVLSTPRVMVKSGEEASFDVGTEVPTISSQATGGINTGESGTGFIQTVQYRKTGILLNIKPVVYSDDRVDIELRQEVSEALPVGADSKVSSPAIFNRSYNTSLSLKDGSAILIAGLMSQRKTSGNSGVPFLKDVPVLGNLFKTQKYGNNKTELVLMIVPYIIETDAQAEELTRSLKQRFELLDLSSAVAPADVPVVPSVPVDADRRPASTPQR